MDPNTLAAWKNIETHLNTPFRKNMVDLVLEMIRDRTTDPRKIATWMMTTSTCICYAVLGVDDPTSLLSLYIRALEAQYPERAQTIYKILADDEQVKFDPSSLRHDEYTGIICAAGSTFVNGELTLINDKIYATEKGLQRLNAIWRIPARRTNKYQR